MVKVIYPNLKQRIILDDNKKFYEELRKNNLRVRERETYLIQGKYPLKVLILEIKHA